MLMVVWRRMRVRRMRGIVRKIKRERVWGGRKRRRSRRRKNWRWRRRRTRRIYKITTEIIKK